jgi:two-component system, OmpR family, alkaline phosphatase synthesis response regulator PhoP
VTAPGERAPARVLVVEDNRDLALGLRVNLEERDYVVQTAGTVADALAALRRFRPHLVILDRALPDGDGVELTRRLRAAGDETLVLLLTASSGQDAKRLGLRLGADDYVTKPFDLEELLLRVEVLLRRLRRGADAAPPPAGETVIVAGDLRIDLRAHAAFRGDTPLALSRIALDLLVALARRRGTVVTRAELMREVWGYDETVASRTLDTHVFELRRQVEPDPGAPRHIRTVWRVGYRFDP